MNEFATIYVQRFRTDVGEPTCGNQNGPLCKFCHEGCNSQNLAYWECKISGKMLNGHGVWIDPDVVCPVWDEDA